MRVDGFLIVQDAHCPNRLHSSPPAETGHLLRTVSFGTQGPPLPVPREQVAQSLYYSVGLFHRIYADELFRRVCLVTHLPRHCPRAIPVQATIQSRHFQPNLTRESDGLTLQLCNAVVETFNDDGKVPLASLYGRFGDCGNRRQKEA